MDPESARFARCKMFKPGDSHEALNRAQSSQSSSAAQLRTVDRFFPMPSWPRPVDLATKRLFVGRMRSAQFQFNDPSFPRSQTPPMNAQNAFGE